MCTYETERVALTGSAKGADGWFRATDATVYVDHPVHFGAGHAVLVDVINPALGASSRVGLELNAESARELALAILRSLDGAPAGLLENERARRQIRITPIVDSFQRPGTTQKSASKFFAGGM